MQFTQTFMHVVFLRFASFVFFVALYMCGIRWIKMCHSLWMCVRACVNSSLFWLSTIIQFEYNSHSCTHVNDFVVWCCRCAYGKHTHTHGLIRICTQTVNERQSERVCTCVCETFQIFKNKTKFFFSHSPENQHTNIYQHTNTLTHIVFIYIHHFALFWIYLQSDKISTNFTANTAFSNSLAIRICNQLP